MCKSLRTSLHLLCQLSTDGWTPWTMNCSAHQRRLSTSQVMCAIYHYSPLLFSPLLFPPLFPARWQARRRPIPVHLLPGPAGLLLRGALLPGGREGPVALRGRLPPGGPVPVRLCGRAHGATGGGGSQGQRLCHRAEHGKGRAGQGMGQEERGMDNIMAVAT